jgi:hypothetical protein
MSHGFPKRRRRQRREKRPQLPKPKPESIAVKAAPTAGLIGELSRPTHLIAFAEALQETQHT